MSSDRPVKHPSIALAIQVMIQKIYHRIHCSGFVFYDNNMFKNVRFYWLKIFAMVMFWGDNDFGIVEKCSIVFTALANNVLKGKYCVAISFMMSVQKGCVNMA